MPSVEFSLKIEALELERYYRGSAQNILVKARNGLKVQFPANLILPYVTHFGVTGEFILTYDQTGKALSLKRINRT